MFPSIYVYSTSPVIAIESQRTSSDRIERDTKREMRSECVFSIKATLSNSLLVDIIW